MEKDMMPDKTYNRLLNSEKEILEACILNIVFMQTAKNNKDKIDAKNNYAVLLHSHKELVNMRVYYEIEREQNNAKI